MSVSVAYREGDCWSVAELVQFSVAGITPHVQYDMDTCDDENPYAITVDHLPVIDMTIITYFNGNGESRNWIASTALYCGDM